MLSTKKVLQYTRVKFFDNGLDTCCFYNGKIKFRIASVSWQQWCIVLLSAATYKRAAAQFAIFMLGNLLMSNDIIIIFFCPLAQSRRPRKLTTVEITTQRQITPCWKCEGRRPHFPSEGQWTGAGRGTLFLLDPLWWVWCACLCLAQYWWPARSKHLQSR